MHSSGVPSFNSIIHLARPKIGKKVINKHNTELERKLPWEKKPTKKTKRTLQRNNDVTTKNMFNLFFGNYSGIHEL